jgi:hypothetical protein
MQQGDKVKASKNTLPKKNKGSFLDWGDTLSKILGGLVVGVILGLGGAYFHIIRDVIAVKAAVDRQEGNAHKSPSETSQTQPPAAVGDVKPEALIDIIVKQQRENVKESVGTLDYQCFSEKDLGAFKEASKHKQIAQKLKHDNIFLDVVLAIKQMRPAKRQELLEVAAHTARKTWAELGRIDREGQTEAGHQAESMIASEIVGLVKELCNLNTEQINGLRG